MNSTHSTLDATSTDRKARLAKLAASKRKASEPQHDHDHDNEPKHDTPDENTPDMTHKYLSGRNYNIETKEPKLGFENNPAVDKTTLEDQALAIAISTAEISKEDEDEKPIDLFKLQPKKPNWDLKRDLAEKTAVLNARTENAIARLVRERMQSGQKAMDTESG